MNSATSAYQKFQVIWSVTNTESLLIITEGVKADMLFKIASSPANWIPEAMQKECNLIAKEDHNKVFVPFTSIATEGTAGEKGTGLGMSIVKRIVDAHNGKIWFESEPEKGTTFFVELPK